MDLKILAELVGIGCTDEEIGAIFDITPRCIQDKRKIEPYKTIFEIAPHKVKVSVRRAQLYSAVKKHNPTMLMWLGKVMLGQKDSLNLGSDPDNPLTFPKIEVTYVKPQE